jgi:hypothetical protein
VPGKKGCGSCRFVEFLRSFKKQGCLGQKGVITAVFHSVETKCRSLVLPSENTCASKAASIVASRSGSRSSKLLFLAYQSKLENVAVFFVFVLLVCSKAELVENFQL